MYSLVVGTVYIAQALDSFCLALSVLLLRSIIYNTGLDKMSACEYSGYPVVRVGKGEWGRWVWVTTRSMRRPFWLCTVRSVVYLARITAFTSGFQESPLLLRQTFK